MPKINLDYNIVKKETKLSDEDLKYKIAMLGTDLDKFAKDNISVEVFPNRPDMLGEYGFLRALKTFIGIESGLKKYKVKKSGEKVIIKESVSKVRPYTVCAIVKNLKLNDEKIEQLIQVQEKLHVTFCRNRKRAAIGIYPSEKIKYPIEFFAENPKQIKFIPLGENHEMDGLQILSRHKTGREFGHLLEGKDKFPFFRDANKNILSMPPIINSETTGKVTEDTKEVFIECSGFDLKVLNQLLNILVCEFSDMGGEIYSLDLIYPEQKMITPDLNPKTMKLKEDYVYKLLGQKLDIKTNLAKMGIDFNKGIATYPAYRTDILHPMDLVEDISIGYGYDNFESELPNISTIGKESPMEKFKAKLSELLVGLNFMGTATFHISNDDLHVKKMRLKSSLIQIENSKSNDYSALRNSLIPSIMEVFSRNADKNYPQKVFDIGSGFSLDKTFETGIKETTFLTIGVAGKDQDFTKVKQIMEYLLRNFGLKPSLKPTMHNSFIEGRSGNIFINKKNVGIIGDVHPEVLSNFSLEVPVSVIEINLDGLLNNVL